MKSIVLVVVLGLLVVPGVALAQAPATTQTQPATQPTTPAIQPTTPAIQPTTPAIQPATTPAPTAESNLEAIKDIQARVRALDARVTFLTRAMKKASLGLSGAHVDPQLKAATLRGMGEKETLDLVERADQRLREIERAVQNLDGNTAALVRDLQTRVEVLEKASKKAAEIH